MNIFEMNVDFTLSEYLFVIISFIYKDCRNNQRIYIYLMNFNSKRY